MMPTCLVEAIQMEHEFKYCKSAWLEEFRHLLERSGSTSSPAVIHYLKTLLKPACQMDFLETEACSKVEFTVWFHCSTFYSVEKRRKKE